MVGNVAPRPTTVRKIIIKEEGARGGGYTEAEDRVERNLSKNPDVMYEVWIEGKLCYRVDQPPKPKPTTWRP